MNLNAPTLIDFAIIKQILKKGKEIADAKSPSSSLNPNNFDLISILQAYSEILAKKHINASEDTIYYKFLLDLSVEYNKNHSKDWWNCFEKLKNKHIQNTKGLLQYMRVLLHKAFFCLYQNQKKNQKRREKSLRVNEIGNIKHLEENHDIYISKGLNKQNSNDYINIAINDKSSTIFPKSSNSTKINSLEAKSSFKREIAKNTSEKIAFQREFAINDSTISGMSFRKKLVDKDTQVTNRIWEVVVVDNNKKDCKYQYEGNLIQNPERYMLSDSDSNIMINNNPTKENDPNKFNITHSIISSSGDVSYMKQNDLNIENDNKRRIKSKCFMKWLLFIKKQKEKKTFKSSLIKKAIIAIQFNYQKSLERVVNAWKKHTIKIKALHGLYNFVNFEYNQSLLKKYFYKYIKKYNKKIIMDALTQKASLFDSKKTLKKYFTNLIQYLKKKTENNNYSYLISNPFAIKYLIYLIHHAYKIHISKYSNSNQIFTSLSEIIHAPNSLQNLRSHLEYLLENNLKIRTFECLSQCVKKNKKIWEYFQSKIVRKMFLCWKYFSKKSIDLKKKLTKYNKTKDRIRLKTSFETLEKYSSRQTKDRFYIKKFQLRKYKEMISQAFSKWIDVYNRCTNQHYNISIITQKYNQFVVGKVLKHWKKWVIKNQKYRMKLIEIDCALVHRFKSKTFWALKQFIKKKLSLKNEFSQIIKHKKRQIIKNYFQTWLTAFYSLSKANKFRENKLKHDLMISLKKIKRNGELIESQVMIFFVKNQKKHKTFYFNMIKKYLKKKKWIIGALEKIHKKLRRKQIQKYYENLRYYCKKHAIRNKNINCIQKKHGYKLIKQAYFSLYKWAKKMNKLSFGVDFLRKKNQIKQKTIFFKKWRNEYTIARKMDLLKKESMNSHQHRVLIKYFNILKKSWQFAIQNEQKAYEFYYLNHITHIYKMVIMLLKNKLRVKKITHNIKKKKEIRKLSDIFKVWKQTTIKNSPMRKKNNKAIKFRIIQIKKKFLTSMRTLVTKLINLKAKLNLYQKNTKKRIFSIWFDEMNNIRLLTQIRQNKNYIIYKKVFNKLKNDHIMFTKLSKIVDILKKFYLSKSFAKIAFYYKMLKKESQNSVKADLYHTKYMRKLFLKKLKNNQIHSKLKNDLCNQYLMKKSQAIKRLFLDILKIKREKNLLRGILLENHIKSQQKIKIKQCFYAYITKIANNKKKKEANQKALTYRRIILLKKSFVGLKKLFSERNENSNRVISHVNKIKKFKQKKTFKLFINQIKNQIVQNSNTNILYQTHRSKLLSAYFSKWLKEYTHAKKANQISQKFIEMTNLSCLKKAFNAWRIILHNKIIKSEEADDDSMNFYAKNLIRKSFESLKLYSKLKLMKSYANEIVRNHLLKKSFEKFICGIDCSLQNRHKKIIALKKYADEILHKSFRGWKLLIKNKFQMKYKKLVDIFDREIDNQTHDIPDKPIKYLNNIDAPLLPNKKYDFSSLCSSAVSHDKKSRESSISFL